MPNVWKPLFFFPVSACFSWRLQWRGSVAESLCRAAQRDWQCKLPRTVEIASPVPALRYFLFNAVAHLILQLRDLSVVKLVSREISELTWVDHRPREYAIDDC